MEQLAIAENAVVALSSNEQAAATAQADLDAITVSCGSLLQFGSVDEIQAEADGKVASLEQIIVTTDDS